MPIEIFKKELIEAEFIDRPNRFIVNCLLNKKNITAYLPNPGKLLELLIKGAKTYLIKGKSTGINYKMVAVLKDSIPVMVDTHVNNIALKELLMRGLIRGFE
ncbi:MAG TPA: sugar fermentation stimulation protein SfsA, partial [Nitrospirae bacterium]|nr:sugar fermentation stimulation protein SfsA [Nitrospirota bacterium]